MKAVINFDVPDWQIGQPVRVFFKDTMEKSGVCEQALEIINCKDCTFYKKLEDQPRDECVLLETKCKPDDFCSWGIARIIHL